MTVPPIRHFCWEGGSQWEKRQFVNLRKLMIVVVFRKNGLSKSVANLPAVKNQREEERDVTIESKDSV